VSLGERPSSALKSKVSGKSHLGRFRKSFSSSKGMPSNSSQPAQFFSSSPKNSDLPFNSFTRQGRAQQAVK